MEQKRCHKCNQLKDEIDFSKCGSGKRRTVCKSCYNKRARKLESKPESRYKEYRRSAKRRNLSFDLTLTQFKKFEEKPCRYCGQQVRPISLDRIDNDIGYVIDNVDSCCYRCNTLKHVFDEIDFLKHISEVSSFQKNK